MKILVAVICCNFKEDTLDECLTHIKKAGFEDILLNFEGVPSQDYDVKYLQEWNVDGSGFGHVREYDQDQAYRLSRICIARNMCLDFAQQKGYDWIFFCDSDCMMPSNAKVLFESPYRVKGGLIPGRGIHSTAKYLFYPQKEFGDYTECHYGSCGSLAIHRSIFWKVRFRWGLALDADVVCSEDPLFASDVRTLFGDMWYINREVKYKHLGDLKQGETAKF